MLLVSRPTGELILSSVRTRECCVFVLTRATRCWSCDRATRGSPEITQRAGARRLPAAASWIDRWWSESYRLRPFSSRRSLVNSLSPHPSPSRPVASERCWFPMSRACRNRLRLLSWKEAWSQSVSTSVGLCPTCPSPLSRVLPSVPLCSANSPHPTNREE